MPITAVLLAGGESRRMGRDKATLVWRGCPLWEWQIGKLRKLQPKKILLSAKSDPRWRPANIDIVLDAAPSRGPLSGLAAALDCIETDHLLALGIDMPFMTTEHLKDLCNRATKEMGVIPTLDGRPEPVAAIYPRTAREEFSAALRGIDFSLKSLVEKLIRSGLLESFEIAASDRGLYKSINEPRDLADFAERGGSTKSQ